ncbi:MAG: hypothetical protein ACKO1K_11290, partial [Burkholderiales bacterium]
CDLALAAVVAGDAREALGALRAVSEGGAFAKTEWLELAERVDERRCASLQTRLAHLGRTGLQCCSVCAITHAKMHGQRHIQRAASACCPTNLH